MRWLTLRLGLRVTALVQAGERDLTRDPAAKLHGYPSSVPS